MFDTNNIAAALRSVSRSPCQYQNESPISKTAEDILLPSSDGNADGCEMNSKYDCHSAILCEDLCMEWRIVVGCVSL